MSLVQVSSERPGVAMLTLDDPERRNALSSEMAVAFASAVTQLAARPDLSAIVVTGAPPVFSAGGDLAMIERQRETALVAPATVARELVEFYKSFLSVRQLDVPVIAAVNGHAIGAGFCLALACDLRVVSATAKFAMNFAGIGLHPGMGATALSPASLGPSRAARLLYTATTMTGAELADCGWAVDTVESDDVLGRAVDLAATIAANSPNAIRAIRHTLRSTSSVSLEQALEAEAAAQVESLRSADLAEGLAAIREKRHPNFGPHARAGTP